MWVPGSIKRKKLLIVAIIIISVVVEVDTILFGLLFTGGHNSINSKYDQKILLVKIAKYIGF